MKLIHLSLVTLLICTSCTHIYFTEVQPKNGKRLTEMPPVLFGTWFYEYEEGWQINEFGITKIDIRKDSLGTIIDTTYTIMPLSDSLQLFKSTNSYVLNYRENSQYWEIAIFHPMSNGDIRLYEVSDPNIFAQVKGLKLVEANYYIDDEYQTVQTLDPQAESSLKFESAVFSGQMKPRSLEKVLTTTSYTLFKHDGTITEVKSESNMN